MRMDLSTLRTRLTDAIFLTIVVDPERVSVESVVSQW